MVSWLRFCVGITLWTYLLQLSVFASELPSTKKQASFLPHSLRPTNKQDAELNSANSRYLITQERQGESKQFTIPVDKEFQPSIPIAEAEVIEVIADRQEYDQQRQIVTAEGNVVMRFAQSVMTSDRLEINLSDRLVVAKGNVVLKRGEQVLRGKKFEYYLVANRGVIYNAGGEVYQPSLSQDTDLSQEVAAPTFYDRALSDRLIDNQPLSNVTAAQGIGVTVGGRVNGFIGDNNLKGGTVNRLRFNAERVDFEADTWTAKNLSLTNDPFSPPELELRAETAAFQQLDAVRGKLTTNNSRLVLDDSVAIPLLASAFVFDSRPGRPGLFNVAFDGIERGGLYIERTLSLVANEQFNWSVTPQYYLQRALSPTTFRFSDEDEGGAFNSAVFGVNSRAEVNFAPQTDLNSNLSLTSFNLNNIDDHLRAKVELQQRVGNIDNPYKFTLAYNYRDRIFNGSLGFREVRNSIGGAIASPQIAVGKTGVVVNFQGSVQNINTDTDRIELLAAQRESNRINLTRYQAAASIGKSFELWQGKPLPSTREQGLRYSPVPVVPFLNLTTGISGVSSFYSNSDTQLSLEGRIGIEGQLGHFSRSWLDYTGFNFSYSQNIRGDESPFLFDRLVDRQILSLGIVQQLYGPVKLGFQTSIDLEDDEEINTDYLIEYSRRTYNIILRYNPVLEIGSFSLRISDFNWQGNPEPFQEGGITPVIQGVEQ